jgi:soluble lytic murein transglycosylase-like protein
MPCRARLALVGFALSLFAALPASAELVYLTSGRTLSVRAHRFEGDTIVLALRTGGQVTCDKALIERIEADEVPYPEPAAADVDQQPAVLPVVQPVPYAELIDNLSATYGVDAQLVRAVVQVESGYRPRARSRKGALGLMQVMPATGRQYGARNLLDPKTNLDAGIRHLKSLLDRFEHLSVALAAYNAGEEAVKRFNGIPPFRETQSYVSKILSLLKR